MVKHFFFQFVCFILIIVVGNSFGIGVKQELWIFLENGDEIYFDNADPDLSQFRPALDENKGIHDYCARGFWIGYTETNYNGSIDRVLAPGYDETQGTGDNVFCGNTSFAHMKSIRHAGVSDLSLDSISLYSGDVFTGKETLVLGSSLTKITTHTKSLISMGKSSWRLFEGQNLNGQSICFESPKQGDLFNLASGYGPIKTIGSVRKGCTMK